MIKIMMLLIILIILLLLVISRINNFILFSRIPRLYITLMIVSFTLIFLLSLRFLNNIESNGTYIPAIYDGEDLIPGKVEIDK